ncbi:MAG: hypothetical protein LBT86_08165 [Deltaproteobacteria bacterium]|jgi:hypothetical protein|nr:hypothetical protein [Deltaproteobacteria bacterium]
MRWLGPLLALVLVGCFSETQAQNLPGDPFGQGAAPVTLPGDPFAVASSPAEAAPRESSLSSEWALTYGGFLESRNRFAIKDGSPVALTQTAFLEMSAKKGSVGLYGSAQGVLEGAAHYWPRGHQAGWAEVKELFLTIDSANLDFWLGQKLKVWGTSDGYNPLDLFNPLDLRDPFPSGWNLNRVPQAMAGASFNLGPVNLEGVYLPKAGVLTMPQPGSPWEPRAFQRLRTQVEAGFLTLVPKNAPHAWFRDGEYGLKLSASREGWDLSLMTYHGFLDEPLYKMTLTPLGLQATGAYARYQAYGLAWAKGLGAGTFRGEMVIKSDYPIQGALNWRRSRLIQTVVGWDRSFDGWLYLNFQGFLEARSLTGAQPIDAWPINVRPADAWPTDDSHGLTYEVTAQWALDAWAAGTRGQVYLTGEGALNEVFLEYRRDDHWKFSVGALFFSGERTGILGQFGDNDCFYLTARHSF